MPDPMFPMLVATLLLGGGMPKEADEVSSKVGRRWLG